MNIEDRIRMAAHNKVRVYITKKKRSRKGFELLAWDGTRVKLPSKSVGLQCLLAIVRCTPERTFYLRGVK